MQHTGGQIHPLDLSEIRTQVAQYLDRDDCTSCMRVNRAWFGDFASRVWHTIDFSRENEDRLDLIPSLSLNKYGHLIRRGINAKDNLISLIRLPTINSLTEIEFYVTRNPLAKAYFMDIYRRNKASLKVLDISANLIASANYGEQSRDDICFFTLDVPVSGFKLTCLILNSICMTRENFSDILEYSPELTSLELWDNLFLGYCYSDKLFQHEGITTLSAPVAQVLKPDPGTEEDDPSLLVHLPGLQTWTDITANFNHNHSSFDIITSLNTELSCHCPDLVKVTFDTEFGPSDPSHISQFLMGAFPRLEFCRLFYNALHNSTLLGILQHQETLTCVWLTTAETPLPYEPDLNLRASNFISMILRFCRMLQIFSATGHKMDFAPTEKHMWACDRLSELRVRIKGLDDVRAVDECLERLAFLRSHGSKGDVEWSDQDGDVVGKHVCRKLLTMKKLKTVWLGSKDYRLATQ